MTNLETLQLIRDETSDEGTFGRLLRGGGKVALTCELPWKENMHKVSCIPLGTYLVSKFNSPSKGWVFLFHDVPNRDMIEMHVGNTILDVIGCVAVGSARGEVHGRPAVINSKDTFKHLFAILPDKFYVVVSGVCG